MTFTPAILTLGHREWKRFLRQKSRIISVLLTPLIFWSVMGFGFGKSFQSSYSTSGYLEYFFPGTLVMTLLFSSIFSMISLIEDRNEGFLQSVMVSPVSHTAIVFGKIAGTASLAVVQTLLLLPFAYFSGLSLSFPLIIELGIVFFWLSIFLCALSFLFAWILNSSQGFHAVMNIVLFPMWILSGALFPMESSSLVLQFLMKLNPLTYALRAIRLIMYEHLDFSSFLSNGAIQKDIWLICICALGLLFANLYFVKKSYR